MKYTDKIFNSYRFGSSKGNDGGLLSAEVDFTIKINNPELKEWDYRGKLYEAVYYKMDFKEKRYNDIRYERSPFDFYVRERLKRITNDGRTFLLVTDYTEKQGSFIITFSFFVFTTFMNYGQFRESLDYLRDDFNFFLREIYPPETAIMVDYEHRPNKLASDINENIFRNTYSTINREFRKLKIIVLLIGVLALGFSFYAAYKIETQPSKPTIDNTTIQTIVRSEIDKVNTEKNNEELLRLLKQQLEQTKIGISTGYIKRRKNMCKDRLIENIRNDVQNVYPGTKKNELYIL